MAAAQHTGLPPNVEPWDPLSHVLTDSRATMAPMGMPEPRPLAVRRMSGSAFSQDRLHEDGRDVPRIHLSREEVVLQRGDAEEAALGIRLSIVASVAVGVRHVVDP